MNNKFLKRLLHIYFILTSLLFIVPFLLIVGISFSNENDITRYGYSLIPKNFTLSAYNYIFANAQGLIDAYVVTSITSVVATGLSILMMALTGYAISRDTFTYKKVMIFFLVITMFFSGGLIPSYIINTQVFGLANNPLIYVLSGLVNAYTIFIFRSFFSQIPKSLIESANLDGASEYKIFSSIILPLSKPVLATFAYMGLIARWNSFEVSLYYITNRKLYSLQYLLQLVLTESKFLAETMKNMPASVSTVALPSETLKFAMCVLAVGPIMFVFPFFQKYFSKGIVVGAVKG